jgi:cation efflux system membrane fusion protein
MRLIASTSLASAAVLTVPHTASVALAHVGHGDEFQQQGAVRQVNRNADSDGLLGVATVKPEQGPDGLTVPSTALVDADGKSLLFVQTEKTYDPVFVETGANQGDRVVVNEGIDPNDDVVISGALSLYAESKKTQQVEAPAADAGAVAKAEDGSNSSGNLPLIAGAAGVAVVVAAGAVLIKRRGKQGE